MASNAKIGLLFGLVVIFAIVFLLNGLLSFDGAGDSNDLSKIVIIDPTGIKPEISPEVFPPGRIPERPPEEILPPSEDKNVEPVESTLPGVYYVVCKGDNLADVAKKFYGPEEGNRRANIKRIFEANRKLLDSPDKIYPGQNLIIPPLWASDPEKNRIESIFTESMFEVVDSIGRRHL